MSSGRERSRASDRRRQMAGVVAAGDQEIAGGRAMRKLIDVGPPREIGAIGPLVNARQELLRADIDSDDQHEKHREYE